MRSLLHEFARGLAADELSPKPYRPLSRARGHRAPASPACAVPLIALRTVARLTGQWRTFCSIDDLG